MAGMKKLARLLSLALLAATLPACDTGPLLRDWYMGKKFIEPELLPERVPRDQHGNPIMPTKPAG
jgi:hypothetical protein